MLSGLLLLLISMAIVALAVLDLRSCITKGISSAYGRSIYRAKNPSAFWISVTCAVLAVPIGLALALTAAAGLLGLI